MKKVKQTEADNFYVFKGLSNANSCFIEKLEHGELFLRYANYFLKDYLKVYDYVINEEGWIFVLKIASEEQLRLKTGLEELEIWRIISERMRLFLSTYVTLSNRMKDRTGCLVHSSYERFYFETLGEAITVINDIRQQRVELYSGIEKYKSCDEHYEITKSIGKGSIYICSRDLRREGQGGGKFVEVLNLQGLTLMVLQEMINSTKKSHNHKPIPNSLKNNPKSSQNHKTSIIKRSNSS